MKRFKKIGFRSAILGLIVVLASMRNVNAMEKSCSFKNNTKENLIEDDMDLIFSLDECEIKKTENLKDLCEQQSSKSKSDLNDSYLFDEELNPEIIYFSCDSFSSDYDDSDSLEIDYDDFYYYDLNQIYKKFYVYDEMQDLEDNLIKKEKKFKENLNLLYSSKIFKNFLHSLNEEIKFKEFFDYVTQNYTNIDTAINKKNYSHIFKILCNNIIWKIKILSNECYKESLFYKIVTCLEDTSFSKLELMFDKTKKIENEIQNFKKALKRVQEYIKHFKEKLINNVANNIKIYEKKLELVKKNRRLTEKFLENGIENKVNIYLDLLADRIKKFEDGNIEVNIKKTTNDLEQCCFNENNLEIPLEFDYESLLSEQKKLKLFKELNNKYSLEKQEKKIEKILKILKGKRIQAENFHFIKILNILENKFFDEMQDIEKLYNQMKKKVKKSNNVENQYYKF